MEINIDNASRSVIAIALIDTQSPPLGKRLPKKIWIKNAKRGRKRITSEN
tara:strand:+ start:253 stop:402 length:150 start_codon:yes stop_codon:yes gene_type:complete